MTHTAKHTPGPWEVKPIGKQLYVEAKDGQGFVCDMQINDALGETDGPRIRANAHLIAAAPAMYEALQQSLALVELAALEEWGRAVRGEQQPPTTEARDRLEKVKAALAQAEGKAR